MAPFTLSGVHPTRWTEIRRRVEVLEAYLAIPAPTHVDEAVSAEKLGMHPRYFAKLAAAWASHRDPAQLPKAQIPTEAGPKKPKLPPEILAIINDAIASAPAGAGAIEVWREVARRCEASGYAVPSRHTIWKRVLAANPQTASAIEGIVVDHCLLNMPVEGTADLPWLSVVATADGDILAYHADMVAPSTTTVIDLLLAAMPLLDTSDHVAPLNLNRGDGDDWDELAKVLHRNGVPLIGKSATVLPIGASMGLIFGRAISGIKLRLQRPAGKRQPKLRDQKFARVPRSELQATVAEAIRLYRTGRPAPTKAASFCPSSQARRLVSALKAI